MIRKAGERIGSRQPAYLVEELGVVEQRSAQDDHIAQDHQRVRQRVGCVEYPLRLAHRDVANHVQAGGDEQRPVQRGARAPQPPAVSHRRDDVNCGRKQVPCRVG